MAGRSSLRRRSPAEWGLRLLLATGAGITGYGAVTHNLALALRKSNVERAYILAPGDGRIGANLSAKLFAPAASAADRARAEVIARKALQRDPTAVDAVTTLGLSAQLRGRTASAKRLLAYSQALSRRDLRTQLWAIEDAVGRGDVTGALRNYDIALRTSRAASDLLFPVLASAIAEPSVRVGLVRTLAARPLWAGNFTDYVAVSGPNPKTTAALFRDLRHVGFPLSHDAQTWLIGSLVKGGAIDKAWSYYAIIHPGVIRAASRDPRFRSSTMSSFDWVPANDPAISASIQRGDGGGVFDFAGPPSVGGPILSQMQVLPAGAYILQGHSIGIKQSAGSRPYWLLNCQGGRELGRVVVPNSVEADGMFVGRFNVPTDCPVQVLSLVVQPSDMVSGISGQIDRVQLRAAR